MQSRFFVGRTVASTIGLAVILLSGLLGKTAFAQSSFATPEAAVAGLVDAVRSENAADAIVSVLGKLGRDIGDSGDPVADEARRTKFIAAFDEKHAIVSQEENKAVLYVGNAEFPFPIPLVKDNDRWQWDVAAGLDEILTRRIGENELNAAQVLRAFVEAQNEYAAQDRDGKGPQFARRLLSREGQKDGLYWSTAEGEDPSPMGPLIARAQAEGYRRTTSDGTNTRSYHGYVYRMLYGQSANAAGGARDYIVNDRMIGGFALIATPAEYGNSGVMTFIINQDGNLFEKDLGPDGAAAAGRMKLFDPDSTWQRSQVD